MRGVLISSGWRYVLQWCDWQEPFYVILHCFYCFDEPSDRCLVPLLVSSVFSSRGGTKLIFGTLASIVDLIIIAS